MIAPGIGKLARHLRSRRGLALVSVLWVLTLLALIAASFTRTTRTEINLARNLAENARAEALADAGVYRAVYGLLQPNEAERWKADGRVYRLRLGGGEVAITIQDEIGKIDLNRAQDELLQGLFELAGLAPDDAAALVDAIVDFRDADDLRRLNGAEDRDYEAAGLPWGAKDAPFEAVEELRQVIGMDPDIYNRVAPALTVHSRRPGFNPNFAPREVLLALPGVAEGRVAGFLDKRKELGEKRAEEAARKAAEEPLDESIFDTEEERAARKEATAEELEEEDSPFPDEDRELLDALAQHPDLTRYYTLGATRGRYTIRAEGRSESGALFIREAVVQVPRSGGAGSYSFYAWRQGRRAEDAEGNRGTQ